MSLDLFLGSVPPRRRSAALFEQVRDGIRHGRLAPGDRLPPTRELAEQLGVSRSTVTTVYGRLVAEGYAEGRIGDGTYIADLGSGPASEPASRPPTGPAAIGPTTGRVEQFTPPAGGWMADLRTGRPDPRLFPVVDWRRSVVTATQTAPPGYGHPAGLPDLRRAIAAWIHRSRGVEATAGRIVVTAGAQGAFDLCARALCRPGDTVAVENPGYAPARRAFELAGVRIEPVPIDTDGMVVDAVPAGARLVLVTPSHQSPSGVILSAERRRRLLDLAAARDQFVIEDDYDTEYRYVDRPLEPLHRLDGGGRVLYVGSFSKTLSPSLRIGFVVAPEVVVEALVATRSVVDTQPPHLTQAALADFLVRGGFERHLRRSRRANRRRRDLLLRRLAEPDVAGHLAVPPSCPAGLHLTITPDPPGRSDALAGAMRARGVAVEATTGSWVGPAVDPALAIGFGLADEGELGRAVAVIAELLADAADEGWHP